MKTLVLALVLVLSLLPVSTVVGQDDEPITKTECRLAVDFDTVEDLKRDLLLRAKRAAVNELFGEYVQSSTEVENNILTSDQILASSLGLLRLAGNASYYNGENLAEVCVMIRAYVTEEDWQKFEPIQIAKRSCVTDQNLTTRQLIEAAKETAVFDALIDYDRRLEELDASDILQLLQRLEYTESGFVPETETYCTRVEGYVTPISVLAALGIGADKAIPVVGSILEVDNQYIDEFDSPVLDSEWSWINESRNNWSLEIRPGNLRIIGIKGNMWQQCNNPRNLLLRNVFGADYSLETKFFADPNTNYQSGGIIIFHDMDNYLKLALVHNDRQGDLSIEMILERDGEAVPDWPWIEIGTASDLYLKIVKDASRFKGLYSLDGKQWAELGEFQAQTLGDAKVGLFASASSTGCENAAPNLPVDFDYFKMIVAR